MKMKNIYQKYLSTKLRKTTLVTGALLMAFGATLTITQESVLADPYQEQIDALQKEVDEFEGEASQLNSHAESLKETLDSLRNQVATIQTKIDLNAVKRQKISDDIEKTQKKIKENQSVLASTVTDLYTDGSVSPVEVLASSSNVGDYLDKQEYRSSVRDGVEVAIGQIKKLEQELETKESDLENTIKEQEGQRAQLAHKEGQQATLLQETQGKEKKYRDLMDEKNTEINELQEQQIAYLQQRYASAFSSGGSSGYPYANDGGESWSFNDCWGPDPWTFCTRQCTSYAAWKVASTGKHMPSHWAPGGDAKNWPDRAQSDGIPTGSTPRAGAVAVDTGGTYGHVMYVESVNDNGTIYVSQYNVNGQGEYSTGTISSAGLTYIYF